MDHIINCKKATILKSDRSSSTHDKKHRKSILRRAKAVYHCAKRHNVFDSNVAAQAKDDLEMIITEPGGGAEEAKTLIILINDQLKKALKSQ